VGGDVTGLVGAGLVLRNSDGTELPVAAGASSYRFDLPSGSAYAFTVKTQPTNPSQTCTLVNDTGTVAASAITNAHVTCVTSSFTVGGAITGLLGTGLVLQNNAGNDLAVVAGATTFSFPVASGSAYAVSVKTQPTSPSQVCAISNASGTVTTANVVNVNVVNVVHGDRHQCIWPRRRGCRRISVLRWWCDKCDPDGNRGDQGHHCAGAGDLDAGQRE
jgi:hypothetical protein